MTKRIILLFAILCVASPASAEDYIKPDWTTLIRALVRFNALTLSDDRLLDDYAAISECDLYRKLHSDDFKWQKVRDAIRESMKMNIATFPTAFGYETSLQLDRYDFPNKIFRFSQKTTIHNVNTITLFKFNRPVCGDVNVKYLPSFFRAVMDTPLYFDGLPLAQKDAEALLKQMEATGNKDRIIYVRFNMRIVYIEPFQHMEMGGGDVMLTQTNTKDGHIARLDVHLDSAEFFEDEAMTKLIYELQP